MRRTALLSAATVLVLSLAACGKPASEAPGGADAPPPADAPAAAPQPAPPPFEANFGARGTEPFWRVDAKGGELKLARPDHPDATGRITDALKDGEAILLKGDVGGVALVLSARPGDCSDGMSDLKYPYTAEVTYGDQVLKGCGFDLGAEPREGQ